MCAEVTPEDFKEFNPMKEVDAYGKVNPFQNPSIGRIPDVKILSDGSYASNEAVYIDQNLLGPQGLIGRTLYIA